MTKESSEIDLIGKDDNVWSVSNIASNAMKEIFADNALNRDEDFAAPQNSSRYEEWKADGCARAAKLQSLYEDKVTVYFNESPSEAKFFVTIGLHMEGDAIRLLDFAKAQGII